MTDQDSSPNKKRQFEDAEEDTLDKNGDGLQMNGTTNPSADSHGNGNADTTSTPPAKRQKTSTENGNNNDDDNDSDASEDLFASSPEKKKEQDAIKDTSRRAGLSKFVRRILDPNRKPTGLIEPPKIIPLNDEFLQAFGRREQDFDEKVGRTTEIDETIPDDDQDNNNDNHDNDMEESNSDQDDNKNDTAKTKVKITNLRYTTSAHVLQEECLNFGPVSEVNLIMDDSDPEGLKNSGRAYVIFETAEAAQACVDQQLGGSLDGRNVRVQLAEELKKGRSSISYRDEPRYYQKDISTKCFRCGQVGHMGAECPNPAKPAVCPLCAAEGHELRQCQLNRICFNCGIPGHINRECRVPRGSQPPRQICSLCCGSGHTKWNCPRAGYANSQNQIPGIQEAVCYVCHQKGHFLCQDLKWFFGLEGIFCYNCGGRGHTGQQCHNRPSLDELSRGGGNDARIQLELNKAQEYKLQEEMELEREKRNQQERERGRQRQQQRDQNRQRYRDQDFNRNRNRHRSAPPPQNRGGQQQEYRYTVGDDNGSSNNNRGYNNNSNRGYNNNNNNRRGGRRGY